MSSLVALSPLFPPPALSPCSAHCLPLPWTWAAATTLGLACLPLPPGPHFTCPLPTALLVLLSLPPSSPCSHAMAPWAAAKAQGNNARRRERACLGPIMMRTGPIMMHTGTCKYGQHENVRIGSNVPCTMTCRGGECGQGMPGTMVRQTKKGVHPQWQMDNKVGKTD